MKISKVSIVRAHDYDCVEIRTALEKGIALVGGLLEIVPQDSKVFIKINHLPPPSPAEKGIVTHPVFLEAVLELLKMTAGDITVGDDIQSGPVDGFQVSGIRQACQRADVKLINIKETGFRETTCKGHFLEKVYLSKTLLDADVIINLPKLKTHSLCVFTGAVKNLYGTIPSGLRRKYHGEYIRNKDFSQIVTDIFSAARPQLTIMDAINAMEGEGPAGGSLRRLGIILTSRDAVAVDAVATKIIKLNPQDVYTTRYSTERGLGMGNLQNIEVVGENIDDVTIADFKLPSSAGLTLAGRTPRFLSRFIMRQISTKPIVISDLCSGCAECQKICPTGAVLVRNEVAEITHDICVECMCCHEVCRFYAVVPKQSTSRKIIRFLANSLRKLRITAS